MLSCYLPGVPSSSSSSSSPGPEQKPSVREKSPTPSSNRNHESCVRTREDQPMAKGWQRGRGRSASKRGKAQRDLSNLMDGLDDDTSPDFLPNRKRMDAIRVRHKVAQQQLQQQSVYTQPDQKLRGTSRPFTDHQEASRRFISILLAKQIATKRKLSFFFSPSRGHHPYDCGWEFRH